MFARLLVRLREVRDFLNLYVLWELSNGVIAMAWGIWVLLPFWIITGKPIHIMTSFAPEHIWGLMFLGMGALQLYVSFKDMIEMYKVVNATKRLEGIPNGFRGVRLICTVYFVTLWAILAFVFQYAVPGTTGVPMYLGMAMLQAVCTIFLMLKEKKKG